MTGGPAWVCVAACRGWPEKMTGRRASVPALSRRRSGRLPILCCTLFCTLCCTLFWPSAAVPDDTEQQGTRARLQQLRADMAALSAVRTRDLKARAGLQANLQQSELAIGALGRRMSQTGRQLQALNRQLAQLQERRRRSQSARAEQQQRVSREIQAAYLAGRQAPLKILLSQEQPDKLARAMTYYEYFFRARRRHIERYLAVINRIDSLRREIGATRQRQRSARATLASQRGVMQQRQRRRERDLRQLNAGIRGNEQKLQQMVAAERQLERLLQEIQQATAGIEMPSQHRGFATLQGQLPWPVAGRASNRYGARRGSGLQWQGLVIPAGAGSQVNAIHNGRVVFADWLRGSGLLLIIDHGDGYLSLYARNQTLLRDVGEWVAAGAGVATVGNSGGQRDFALYFEIRHKGQPVNPGRWLASG